MVEDEIFQRYTIEVQKLHCLQIYDNIKHRKYGCFDRFEREQLQRFCDVLNEENQASQDYEDFVSNIIISSINSERTFIGKSVLKQLAEELGVDYEEFVE